MDKLTFFGKGKRFVIGMVHLLPLPGTMGFEDNMEEISDQAVHDAKTLADAGVDAVMVENMGDNPLGETLDTEQRVALAAVAARVKDAVDIPVGIDAAFNDYKAALSIAKAIDASFVRIPVFVDTVMYFGGTIHPCARDAMKYRKQIWADNVRIFADVQVKHTFPVNDRITIEDSAKQAKGCGADAIIVTGTSIGEETPLELMERVKKVVDIPIIAGSGVNPDNVNAQFEVADGAIVGSSLKEDKDISRPISYDLTKQLMDARNEGVK